MKRSVTKSKVEDNRTSVNRPRQPRKCLHQIHNKGKQRIKFNLLPQTLTIPALYAEVTTGYGSVEFSRKRLHPRDLSWWRIINFAFRA